MRKAIILVNADTGSERELESELKKIDGIVGVNLVYGVYDLVVEVEAETDRDLKNIVLNRIRALGHIRATLTLGIVS